MNYFVTGATGFIGKFLVERLLKREGKVYILAREASQHKVDALKERLAMAADRIIPVYGDLSQPLLGLDDATRAELRGQIGHVFHVAAIYDLTASAESQQVANVEGTRNAVQCAEDLQAGCFHHVSSIAAAGKYQGTFREGMFEEAGDLSHPYFRTKHDSEGLVRQECKIPWRVYRPASVVGHSETGEIDKADGPYYSFPSLAKLRRSLPPWFPLLTIDMGKFNIVPVDYVVDAMDHIAHKEGCDYRAFHLTNPDHYSAGEMMNIFAEAAKAPRFALRLDTKIFSFIPKDMINMLSKLPPVKRMMNTAMEGIGMPADATMFFTWNTEYDNRETEIALRDSGIECPNLESYSSRIWDYWERNLDPELFIDRSLRGNVAGKLIIITGGGTGIGLASAIRLGEAGARIVLSGRTMETLEDAKRQVEEVGGEVYLYQSDAADMEACDAFIDQVIADHGQVDILINNAGRSIRRAVEHAYDRFHDFERTMQINYFGALRLTLKVLPGMSERRSGHIINISSMGVVGPPARFSAYIASKSALEGFSRCAEAEFCNRNIAFTNINMPLVRTPMIGPTAIYDVAPTLSPEQAADMVVDAVINKPSRIVTGMGRMFQIWHLIAPKTAATAMNIPFSMFDESALAKGMKKPDKVEASSEQVAMAALMKGVHF